MAGDLGIFGGDGDSAKDGVVGHLDAREDDGGASDGAVFSDGDGSKVELSRFGSVGLDNNACAKHGMIADGQEIPIGQLASIDKDIFSDLCAEQLEPEVDVRRAA